MTFPSTLKCLFTERKVDGQALSPWFSITGETVKVQLSSGPTDFRSTVVKPFYEEDVGDVDDEESAHSDAE
jgi:hypothetical protein